MDRYRSIAFYDQGRALPKDINFEHTPCFFYRQSRRMKLVPFDIFRCQVDVVVYTGMRIIIQLGLRQYQAVGKLKF